jgi:Mlc titration factor MtfA (ptsG expression regulator)
MKWWTQWKRRRVLGRHAIDDGLWRRTVLGLPFLGELERDDAARLRELTLLFLAEKAFSGAQGLEPTDAMRVAIAAQASLLILNLGLDWYDDWVGIVVYPGDFRVRRRDVDDTGVVHEWNDTLAGEAMPGGPVVLSWDSAAHATEMNVVVHEFAHKLDMRNGAADGLPPLHADMDRRAWHDAFRVAYDGVCDAIDRGRETWLDPYAAEHPSEFFAVLSEAFFEQPQETRRRYPDVYDQLRLFYRQDPARRALP